MITNVLEYLENTVTRVPQKLAFSDGCENCSFAELYGRARSLGSFLCGLGIYREPVAILMKRQPRAICAFMGCLYAGAFYVPLDADMPAKRMEKILETLKPRVLICAEDTMEKAYALTFEGSVYCYEDITEGEENPDALAAVRAAHVDTDAMYVVFTSGSTGTPKGVVANHRSVIEYTEHLSQALGFHEGTVFANQTPLFFDAPLKEIMPTLKFGATTYLVPKMLFMFPIKLVEFLNEHRVNTICWVVSALTMISSLGVFEKQIPTYLTTVAFGSEVFPRKQYDLWRAALPQATFYNLYGPTEATGMSCYWRADRALAADEPIPVGRPFKNTEILLISEDGYPILSGEVGEIYIRGTCVTQGYFANPEKTAEAFVQNPLNKQYPETVYRTGDLGYLNEHGELVFVSRKDYQIKHMGHRIELGEIEAAVHALEGIHLAACVYNDAENQILLFYTGTIATKEVVAELKESLPRYMLPSLITCLDRMPMTPNGKIDRKQLLNT